MAYSDNFPAVRPVFQADFANGGRIDPRATFSRASTGTHFGTDKHISSENLLTYSSQFTNGWTGDHITLNSTPVTGPDGVSSNAYEITEDSSTTTQFRIYQDITDIDGGAVTVYAKLGDSSLAARKLTIKASVGTNNLVVGIYDLSTGTASLHTGSASTYTGVSVSQTASGNGFYKCVLTIGTGTIGLAEFGLSDGTTPNQYGLVWYSGNNTSSIILSQASVSSTGASDYNGTSTSIHREYSSTLQTAASGAARFEHSATDGQSEGILIESQSTNLVTYSSDLTNAFYTKSRASADGNVAVAPDGTLTADHLRSDSTAADTHGMYFQYTVSGTNPQTISFYAKASGNNWVQVRFSPTNGVFGGDSVYFDLANGAVGTTDSDITASIESCGNNGWYRCIATRTALSSGTGRININLGEADNDNTFDGDSFSGVLLWGIMAEDNSSHASSFIATSGSTATRAADSLSVATSDIGYTGGPITVVTDTSTDKQADNNIALVIYKDSNNTATWYCNSTNTRGLYSSGGGRVLNFATTGNGKRAIRLNTNDIAGSLNGAAVVTDSGNALPDLTGATAYFGASNTGGNSIDGHIKRVAIYSEPLSDSNLQAVTS